MKKILLIIFSQCICVVFICATNIVDSIKYEYSEVFDPIRQIDLYYIHKDNYGKGTEILPKYLHTNEVIIDDTIIDTVCIQIFVNLQFDTINIYNGKNINYEIVDFHVIFTRPKDIENDLLEYLIEKIKNELKNYELYVEYNVNKPTIKYNSEKFSLRFIFVPLDEN